MMNSDLHVGSGFLFLFTECVSLTKPDSRLFFKNGSCHVFCCLTLTKCVYRLQFMKAGTALFSDANVQLRVLVLRSMAI